MEVTYEKASYNHRIFAFLIDLAVTFILGSLIAWGFYSMMPNFPFYQSASETYDNLQLESGLYVQNGAAISKIDKYYESTAKDEANAHYESALVSFYQNKMFFSDPSAGSALYREQKVGAKALVDSKGETYWVVNTNGDVVRKEGITDEALNAFYVSALEDHAYAYLTNNVDYVNASRTLTWSGLISIPIALNITLVFVSLVIPLCFSRGKKTLGKMIFHLAVLNVHACSVSWGHYLLRFLFLLLIEVDLSLVSFGIPLIVSFSMFVFSKRGQSLHDYVCNTYVVDSSTQSIYINQHEYEDAMAQIEHVNITKKDGLF
jgi:uncharacterized RDD family membrane protein YckC